MTEEKRTISKADLATAMNYEHYYSLIKDLLTKNKTTGNHHSNKLLQHARLNFQRMRRIYRTTKLTSGLVEKLENISSPQIWVVLTEGWCGDAAQSLPAIARMAECSEKIDLRIFLRDEHLDIMDAFLTHGSRSIPKLIAIDAKSHELLFHWGPRPKIFQQMVMDFKQNPQASYEAFSERLHKAYTTDKTTSLQKEIAGLLQVE